MLLMLMPSGPSSTASCFDFGQCLFGALRRSVVVDNDMCAFLREADGDGASYALAASRYERNLIFQSHFSFSRFRLFSETK